MSDSATKPRTLAVMQPYFLPYIGYFQLIASADFFVLYDDVQFVKQSWMNRNRILLGGAPHRISIPVSRDQQGGPIHSVLTSTKPAGWRDKMLRTIASAYSKARSFDTVFPMLERWLPTGETPISRANQRGIREICDHLGIRTEIVVSSGRGYHNAHLPREDRLVDICHREGATRYVNSPGGRALYQASMFEPRGIELRFLRPRLAPYRQGKGDFIPGLSILDVLMHNTRDEARDLLAGAELEA